MCSRVRVLCLIKSRNECMDKDNKQKQSLLSEGQTHCSRKEPQSRLPLKLFVQAYMYTLLAFDWSFQAILYNIQSFQNLSPQGLEDLIWDCHFKTRVKLLFPPILSCPTWFNPWLSCSIEFLFFPGTRCSQQKCFMQLLEVSI